MRETCGIQTPARLEKGSIFYCHIRHRLGLQLHLWLWKPTYCDSCMATKYAAIQ